MFIDAIPIAICHNLREKRYKVLYSPLKDQMKDNKVKKFIKMRANPKYAFKVAKI